MTATDIVIKICRLCCESKPISEFHKNKAAKNGIDNRCKACTKAADAIRYAANPKKMIEASAAWKALNKDRAKSTTNTWRAANPDREKGAKAAWNAANRDKTNARAAIYREKNREKLNTANAKWVAANPEKAKANTRAWAVANRDARRISGHNRRIKEVGDGDRLSKGLSKKLFALQKGLCVCCKQPLSDGYHLDHIMPLALGGTNTDDNMQLLKAICNLQKGAKRPEEFMQSKGFLL